MMLENLIHMLKLNSKTSSSEKSVQPMIVAQLQDHPQDHLQAHAQEEIFLHALVSAHLLQLLLSKLALAFALPDALLPKSNNSS